MDIRRVILYAALALVVYSLWMNWQVDYPPELHKTVTALHSIEEKTTTDSNLLPTSMLSNQPSTAASVEPVVSTSAIVSGQPIHVKTDVLDLYIDLKQGDIIEASLLDYPVSINEKDKPFILLTNTANERYVANSSLFLVKDNTIENADANYTTETKKYELLTGQTELVVSLKGKNQDGLKIRKEFILTKGSYLIQVRYVLVNEGASLWKGYMNTQLLRRSPSEDKSSIFHVGSYTGSSYSNPGHNRYKKVEFKDMTKTNLDLEVKGGWIAMQQHYFLTAWVPEENSENRFYTRAINGDYALGAVSQPILVAPSQQKEITSRLYLGPENTGVLKTISPSLDLTVDYGWLWFLSSLIFSLMKKTYAVVGNWGWSIVLVTVLIKLAFYRLSATSYKSMAGMRKLQPKLQALKERYGDDKAKISQATMELYKQEKVNPLGGCLPIVIQIPVFIALYWVLLESIELRQAPFIFWIKDLAMADPLHILPVIMGATMLIQQKLNPAPPDPMQAKIMMFLPLLFTGLFWNFPAGLVLYWIVNNSLSILQQWYITRKYSEDKPNSKLAVAK